MKTRSRDSTGGGGGDGAGGEGPGTIGSATARGGEDDGHDAGGPVTATAVVASDDCEVPNPTETSATASATAAAALVEGSPRRDSRTASVDDEGSPGHTWPVERLSLTKSLLQDNGEFDGERVTAVLGAALRLQRLLFGLARLHLGQLGEGHTRAVMGGLSSGLRHARAFQAQQGLRASLLSSGYVLFFVLCGFVHYDRRLGFDCRKGSRHPVAKYVPGMFCRAALYCCRIPVFQSGEGWYLVTLFTLTCSSTCRYTCFHACHVVLLML